jgi:hypothetical protein
MTSCLKGMFYGWHAELVSLLNFTKFTLILLPVLFKQHTILLLGQSTFQEVWSQVPAAGCCHIPVTFVVYSETASFGSIQATFGQQ